MPEMIPRTKARQGEQLGEVLQGELAAYEKVGLFQRSVNTKTAYRYRGVLLRYQKALGGFEPTIKASKIFLAHLREHGFKPSTLRIYRAALQGFHLWRSENLVFPIRVPHHSPPYIEADIITRLFDLAQGNHRDQLILRLLADAGLRREEAVNLKVRNVGEKALRIRGKGDKDRTIPLTERLVTALRPFCSNKNPDDSVLSVGEGVIYRLVKKYARFAGKPELKPHDLRHAFATRLLERGVNIRVVQELLGHSNLNTTQVYTAVSGQHLEDAIRTLEEAGQSTATADQPQELTRLTECIDRDEGGGTRLSLESAIPLDETIKSPLTLSILEGGRRVIDNKTGKYARLVKFRLGSISIKPIVVENIFLEILESETAHFGPSIEGLIVPYTYDVELSLKGPSEYKITDDNFRLAKYDTDDFEVLCTAMPGFICRARIKVCYTEYPDTKILTTCSEPFVLTFPESGSACNKPDKLLNYIIGESLEDDLKTLINYKGCLSEDDDGELRVYLREPLSDIRLQDIEKQLKTSGVTLLGPVSQDYCCLFISFRYNEATLLALSDIEVPRPGGWQLFDSKAMQKQREYDHKELNDASQR